VLSSWGTSVVLGLKSLVSHLSKHKNVARYRNGQKRGVNYEQWETLLQYGSQLTDSNSWFQDITVFQCCIRAVALCRAVMPTFRRSILHLQGDEDHCTGGNTDHTYFVLVPKNWGNFSQRNCFTNSGTLSVLLTVWLHSSASGNSSLPTPQEMW
jgi:hypothetical protein